MKFWPKWHTYCAGEHGLVISAEIETAEGPLSIQHLVDQQQIQATPHPTEEIAWHVKEISERLQAAWEFEQ